MEKRRVRRAELFASRRVRAVALTAVLAFAALAGAQKSLLRFGSGAGAGSDLLETALQLEESAVEANESPLAADALANEPVGPAWDLPNLDHPRVDDFVRMFTTGKRGEFGRFLQRSGRYEAMISQKLAERGMPQDLIYLAMIESGFNSRAYSHAHASGLWQFIAATGQRYGLDINLAVDERRDPVKATDAALTYLEELHRRFGSWYLAAAAYNTGENRVGRIMREETGSERGTEESYYKIRHRLPRETRDYVPLMVAAARISKEPARYGFDQIQKEEPLAYDEVTVPAAASLAAIARASGTDVARIRALNPHFKLERTRNDRASVVRVPQGSGQAFAANWPSMAQTVRTAQAAPQPRAQQRPQQRPQQRAQSRTHQVRRGESLSVIASRHGVSVSALRSANGLRGDRIRAGQTLRIPAGQAARPQQRARAQRHQVRQGENLTVIARRHGVSVAALRSANGIRGDRIRAGQTLRIPG
jgi:membrane-bound lytic murein transglycosylase D